MKNFLMVTATLLTAALPILAQSSFNRRSSPALTDPYQSGLKVYYKTWADLNDAQRRVAPNPGDWYRYDVARGQMDLLERTWSDGSFDGKQLNEAIADLRFVLDVNHLAPLDRDILAADLNQLRDIRIQYGG